jgi:hypothetical protein
MNPASTKWLKDYGRFSVGDKPVMAEHWKKNEFGFYDPVNKPCDYCGVVVPLGHLCDLCADSWLDDMEQKYPATTSVLQSSWPEPVASGPWRRYTRSRKAAELGRLKRRLKSSRGPKCP